MRDALVRYAETFHATAGGAHHVASPLGAWLLLALCAPAASGADRAELEAVVGVDAAEASEFAAALLATPHPLIAAAAAVWHRMAGAEPAWLAGLPAPVTRGRLESQEQLDEWAREHTFGLIDRFPLALTPQVLLVLATALATRVSWDEPFDVAPAAQLGAASPWASRLTSVLRTPGGHGHVAYVASSTRAGDVAVHLGRARDGLDVTSVIAAADVPVEDVLAAAHEVALGGAQHRSLFDLPLGETPLWTISEEEASVRYGREERCVAFLPAWSATSEHKLARADLGFPAAARAVAEALGLTEFGYDAKQAAVAKFSRVGFEAAAVSAMYELTSAPIYQDGLRRVAELRFGHPYAVVAVARLGGPWNGLPVFSAWVAAPETAP